MRTLCLLVVVSLGAPAMAQEAAPASQAAAVDEVIVPGTRPENLRVEIERLERVVYERWNALNSNDEFDVHCLDSEPTGSNITQTRCAPNFVIWAESRAAKNTIDGDRTAGSDRQTDYMLEMQRKSRQLTEEMQRVARQDEQFLRELARLDELRQLQANEKQQRRKR
ncbi:MAG TPA: hypothetical protein VF405_13180 [Gammaproteobacteria bacterium]|jgi:hypothetical protein